MTAFSAPIARLTARRAGCRSTPSTRAAPAEGLGGGQNFANLIRTGARFLHEIHARLLDLHFFGAGADEGMGGADQDSARRSDGHRHLLQFQSAILVLRDLFHANLEL